ncbi:MAG: glycosyltransferase, partial [Pseudomonadota bacterium]
SSCMFEDLFPALIHKIRNPRTKLVVSVYLLPTPPWRGAYGSTLVNRYIFWIMYSLGIYLARMTASTIWTASEADAAYIRQAFDKRAKAIRGGVDLTAASRAKRKSHFQALSLGRFHPQKNLFDLLDIWTLVNRRLPGALLVLAGAGFLKKQLQERINQLGLTRTVEIVSAIDGQEKFNMYASSDLFVSASQYDTGNLALDEALACGTPGVLYETGKMYFPKGVAWVPIREKQQFADVVVELLQNNTKRRVLAQEAVHFARTLSWDSQAEEALKSLWQF